MNKRLYHNGIFFDGEQWLPSGTGMLCYGESVEALLSPEELLRALAHTDFQLIDLEGQCLSPAFHDPHIHIWKTGHLMNRMLDLRGCRSIYELQQRLADFARQNKQLDFLVGRGFNENLFDEKRLPLASDLDEVVAEQKVFLIRTCAHIAVTNSAGLKSLGEEKSLKIPPGGQLGKNAKGNLNGLLYETAQELLFQQLPVMSSADYQEDIRLALEALASAGFAFASDPAVSQELWNQYRAMEEQELLPIHTSLIFNALDEKGKQADWIPEAFANSMLSGHCVKFFADGGLSGKTAALRGHYRNDTERGWLRMDDETFLKVALHFAGRGFDLATHAIGDLAIDQVIRIYRQVRKQVGHDRILRIEHLGLPDEEQLQQIAELDIHVVSQPIFIRELGGNFLQYLDKDYLERCYPYKSILRHHINLAFSSDAPVVKDFSWQSGIRSAMNRKTESGQSIQPEEAIPLEGSLKAYTLGAALCSGLDKKAGRLAKGYSAKFTLFDQQTFEK